jgi:hypothetical protein
VNPYNNNPFVNSSRTVSRSEYAANRELRDTAAHNAGIRFDDDGLSYSVKRDPGLIDLSFEESTANKYYRLSRCGL